MALFDVYSLFDVTPVRAAGCRVWDEEGRSYLDLYGGHAVISIGHSHPHYVDALSAQLQRIGFYSNSVRNPLQEELASRLGAFSAYNEYSLFLDNSGAESNENALKLASFHTGRSSVIAFRRSFHGRTSGAVAVTDNPAIVSSFNAAHKVHFCELGDLEAVERTLAGGDVAAVIVEGIQGCGGIHLPSADFLQGLSLLCRRYGACLILDEVQSGCGRTGRYFSHQWAGVRPDLITMGKGIANGFPCGAVLISPEFKASKGLLGTTFGGNYLACAAALAVLDVMEGEKLLDNAAEVGEYLLSGLRDAPFLKDLRGRGLMIGLEFKEGAAAVRRELLYKHHIFTGAAGTDMIRLLPPLCLTKAGADEFLAALPQAVEATKAI